MWLTQLSIRRPLLISMLLLFFVLIGAVAYTKLGAEQYPQIDIPVVVVVVPYPGAGPQEVESGVSKVVEDAVAGTGSLKTLYSYSMEGLSVVQLEFSIGADIDAAATDVERKVGAIRSQLPDEARAPSVLKAEFDALPIMTVSVSGARPDAELYTLVQDKIKGRLEAVNGVAAVRIVGGRQREIAVKVDQAKLQARGLSIQQVSAALGQSNLSMPSGRIEERGLQYNVRLTGLVQTPAALGDIVLRSLPSGTVYLRDVAHIEDGFKRREMDARADGTQSIGLMITKASGANTIQVARELRGTLAEVGKLLPPDVKLNLANDTSTSVTESLNDIQVSLFYAVILTGIVLLLFLHSLRSTIIVLFSIPTSLISAFAVMWVMGFTLNMMSMMALALSVGILVDDSIVVLENIFRHLKLGETPWTAALKGRNEIGLAAMAITLVDVVVYVPMAFMSGMVGQFFRQFGLTVAVATLFSLLVSFTLTPMLASRWLKAEESAERSLLGRFGVLWEGGFARLTTGYQGLLAWALGHRKTVVVAAAVALIGSMALVPLGLVGSEFMPTEDFGEVYLTIEMPPGTPLQTTNDVVLQLESRLSRVPEVTHYFSTVGESSGGMDAVPDGRRAHIEVKLVPKSQRSKSIVQMTRELQTLGEHIPGLTLKAGLPSIVGGGGAPFVLLVRGDDPATLRRVATEVVEVVKRVPGTSDVTNSAASGAPEARFQVDQQRLADLGLSSSALATALRTNAEGLVIGQLRPEGQSRVDIRVVGSDADRGSLASLAALPIVGPGGNVARLDQTAALELVDSPAQLERRNRQPLVVISAGVLGRPLGDVVGDFRTRMKDVTLPAGVSVALAGETEAMDESFTSMIQALGLSIVLMYMLMVALYESPIYPLVIMFALPVSFIGAFGALAITGQTLNVQSMIGMIMLMGLVGKNGILLVDYTNTLRQRGKTRPRAVLEAGPARLRPILMTTAAMVMAMIPIALQIGQGSAGRSSMAVVVIGGLISSTLLTLLVVPVMYTLFDDAQSWLGRHVFRRGARGSREGTVVASERMGAETTLTLQPAASIAYAESGEMK